MTDTTAEWITHAQPTLNPSPTVDTFRHKLERIPLATYDMLKAVVGPELDAYVTGGVTPTHAYVERVLAQLAAIEAGTSAAGSAAAVAQASAATLNDAVPTADLQRRITALGLDVPPLPPTMTRDEYARAEAWVTSNEPKADAFDQQLADALDALAARVDALPDGLRSEAQETIEQALGVVGFSAEITRRPTWTLSGWTPGRYEQLVAIVTEHEDRVAGFENLRRAAQQAAEVVHNPHGIPRAADLPPAREPNVTPDPTHPPEAVKDVKAWVADAPLGTPRQRAEMALRVEQVRAKPRASLVSWLEAQLAEDPAGATTPPVPQVVADAGEGVAAASPTAAAPSVELSDAADAFYDAGAALIVLANAIRRTAA